jgi:hypothetical protein
MTVTRRDDGFSVAELLIAMTLSVTIIGTALGGFRNLSEASDGVSLGADMNVNLRTTINLMTRDLLSAGRGIPVGGIGIPSGNGVQALFRPSPLDNLTFPVGVTLPAVSPGNAIGPAIGDDPATVAIEGAQTDLLSILMSDPSLVLDQLPLTGIGADGRSVTVDPATPIDVQPDGINVGDLIMLTNARGSTLMMVTGRVGQTIQFDANDPMRLNQVGAPAGTIFNLQSAPGVWPPTTATRIQMISYYLDDSDRARPRLMRRVNMFPPRPIGVVIENLQLTYDTVNGVDNPQNQPAPPPNQIRKANVFVAGRTHREWRRTNNFLRTSVSAQVSLRSLAFVDRYQ